MKSILKARLADAKDLPIDAMDAYQAAMALGTCEPDVYLDAAAICLMCADLGYASAHRLPSNMVEQSYTRAVEILAAAARTYPGAPQVQFWLRYLDYVVLGAPDFVEEAQQMLAGGALEASAYLFSISGGTEARSSAALLLLRVREGRTARERHLRSLLTSKVHPLPM
jgi:hypothetical protein